LTLLWTIGVAAAIQVGARDVPCPVGSGTARVYERLSSNAQGGHDSDLAGYSSGGQWRAYRVASCAPSGFTLFGTDMTTPPPLAKVPALEAELARVKGTLPKPDAPEVWDRYRIAAALYAVLGKDDVFLGDLWVEASWTARDAAVGFYAGLEGPLAARRLLTAGWEELKKPLSDADRKRVLYNLARVAHRGGWSDERAGFLAAFEAVGSLTAEERTALERFRTLAGTVEPALQDEAIARYTAALRAAASDGSAVRTELPHDEKVRVTYVLADLLRRRGRAREALPLYFLVANDAQAPEQLRGMALFLAEPLAANGKPAP
jgi:hypothetical protein